MTGAFDVNKLPLSIEQELLAELKRQTALMERALQMLELNARTTMQPKQWNKAKGGK